MSEDFEASNSKVSGESNTSSPRTVGATATSSSNGYSVRKSTQPRARRMSLSLVRVDAWSVAKVTFLLSVAGNTSYCSGISLAISKHDWCF